jgi:hypothetical protein
MLDRLGGYARSIWVGYARSIWGVFDRWAMFDRLDEDIRSIGWDARSSDYLKSCNRDRQYCKVPSTKPLLL